MLNQIILKHTVNKKSRFVIELNAGSISKIGLEVGHKINDEKVIIKEFHFFFCNLFFF